MWPFKKKQALAEGEKTSKHSDEKIGTPYTNNQKPKKKIWEKVVMGAIVGGAIGSVIGASIAPKKGSETREDLGEIAQKAKKSSGIFFRRFKKMLRFRNNPDNSEIKQESEESIKKIPHE